VNNIVPFYKNYFSNFYITKFYSDRYNHWFTSTEQYFMYSKALYFNDVKIAQKILKTSNPDEIKGFGRRVANFVPEDWLQVSYEYMVEANLLKFMQNPYIRTRLLETGDKILVEASPKDLLWGVGLSLYNPDIYKKEKWLGENKLGLVLMEVRETIKLMLT
jgi:ribA/ribD-fused uncharacterized protein